MNGNASTGQDQGPRRGVPAIAYVGLATTVLSAGIPTAQYYVDVVPGDQGPRLVAYLAPGVLNVGLPAFTKLIVAGILITAMVSPFEVLWSDWQWQKRKEAGNGCQFAPMATGRRVARGDDTDLDQWRHAHLPGPFADPLVVPLATVLIALIVAIATVAFGIHRQTVLTLFALTWGAWRSTAHGCCARRRRPVVLPTSLHRRILMLVPTLVRQLRNGDRSFWDRATLPSGQLARSWARSFSFTMLLLSAILLGVDGARIDPDPIVRAMTLFIEEDARPAPSENPRPDCEVTVKELLPITRKLDDMTDAERGQVSRALDGLRDRAGHQFSECLRTPHTIAGLLVIETTDATVQHDPTSALIHPVPTNPMNTPHQPFLVIAGVYARFEEAIDAGDRVVAMVLVRDHGGHSSLLVLTERDGEPDGCLLIIGSGNDDEGAVPFGGAECVARARAANAVGGVIWSTTPTDDLTVRLSNGIEVTLSDPRGTETSLRPEDLARYECLAGPATEPGHWFPVPVPSIETADGSSVPTGWARSTPSATNRC